MLFTPTIVVGAPKSEPSDERVETEQSKVSSTHSSRQHDGRDVGAHHS